MTGRVTTKPDDIEAQRQRRKALELRNAGATFEDIAKASDGYYSSRASAYKAVSKAMSDITREPAEEALNLELARLDKMQMGLWQDARNGDTKAVNSVLRLMERRAKLLGLDDYEARMADVAERQIELEEEQAKMAAAVLSRVFNRLELTPEQRALIPVVVPEEFDKQADIVAGELAE